MMNKLIQVQEVQDTTMRIAKQVECAVCHKNLADSQTCQSRCETKYPPNMQTSCVGERLSQHLEQLNESLESHNVNENIHFHMVIESVKSCLQFSVSLLHQSEPDTHNGLVEAVKTIKAAYLLVKQCYALILECPNGFSNIDLTISLSDLNAVTGNLNSLFISTDHENILRSLNITRTLLLSQRRYPLNRRKAVSLTVDPRPLCNGDEFNSLLVLPVNIMRHIRLLLQKIMAETKIGFRTSTIQLAGYALVLGGMFLISVFEYFQLKKILLQLVELKYDYLRVKVCLQNEEDEFREVMGELVPLAKVMAVHNEHKGEKNERRHESQEEKIITLPAEESVMSDLFSSNVDALDQDDSLTARKASKVSSLRSRKISRVLMSTIDEENTSTVKKLPDSASEGSGKKNSHYIQDVTVLQLEIAGFNQMIEFLSPSQLINTVSYLIKLLEERIRLYDVYILTRDMNSYTVISGMYTDHYFHPILNGVCK